MGNPTYTREILSNPTPHIRKLFAVSAWVMCLHFLSKRLFCVFIYLLYIIFSFPFVVSFAYYIMPPFCLYIGHVYKFWSSEQENTIWRDIWCIFIIVVGCTDLRCYIVISHVIYNTKISKAQYKQEASTSNWCKEM